MSIQFRARLLSNGASRRLRRAMGAMADFTPEMARVGDWLIEDARTRLQSRKSRSGIGRLAQSLKARAFRTAVAITSVLPYARIQQEGGIVRPRKRKFLAIPLRDEDKRVHLWPKHVSGRPGVHLFVVNTGPQKILMYSKKAKGQKPSELYPRWLLVKQSKIPARPFLVKSAALIDFLREQIKTKLRRAAAG